VVKRSVVSTESDLIFSCKVEHCHSAAAAAKHLEYDLTNCNCLLVRTIKLWWTQHVASIIPACTCVCISILTSSAKQKLVVRKSLQLNRTICSLVDKSIHCILNPSKYKKLNPNRRWGHFNPSQQVMGL